MLDTMLIIVLAIVLCESVAMSCVKNYNITHSSNYIVFAILAYAAVCFFLNKSLNYNGIAKVNVLWSGLSVLASTLLGVLYFKEVLHGHDYLAMAMIAAGVMILKTTD
jgi:multidrug transporter EmrE-like cation transporter